MREVLDLLWEDLSRTVAREEFLELRAIVEELVREVRALARAQERTEERIGALVEAQRRTEAQVEELTKAQRRTEERVSGLEEAVKALAEAQRKTEERVSRLEEAVERLAEAQRKTEERLDQLAEAQRRTEEELRKLIGEHRRTREELGGLSHTVGYILEDRAYVSLPELLKRDTGVEVEELKRDFVEFAPGRYEEINILGKGRRDGERVWIIGDCKAQLKKRDVDAFLRRLSRIEHLFPGEKVYVAVTYQASPQVREYLEGKGLRLYLSYQLRI